MRDLKPVYKVCKKNAHEDIHGMNFCHIFKMQPTWNPTGLSVGVRQYPFNPLNALVYGENRYRMKLHHPSCDLVPSLEITFMGLSLDEIQIMSNKEYVLVSL